MEDNLIKPDVVLVTKNVMVPLALPTPKSKLVVRMSASKKKTKIVSSRKTRPLTRQTLHFSQDDGKHERGKDTSEQIYLNCKYDSSIDLDHESEEDYENSDQFCDFLDEAKTKIKTSSHSFPMAGVMKTIPNSICKTILLPKSSISLKPNSKRTIAKETFSEISKKDESDCLRTETETVGIFKDKSSNSLRKSITEIRRCISGDISSKCFNNDANRRVETFAKDKCVIKYSWQDLDNWLPPSEKKKIIETEKISKEPQVKKPLNCEIKYSWQIVGTAVQTSAAMIEILPLQDKPVEVQTYPCSVKYSWQIIGTGTQVSFRDNAKDPSKYENDYWDGKIVNTVKRSLNEENSTNVEMLGKVGKCKILYSIDTQTTADKIHQTDTTDCRVKYSWQNLTKAYLAEKRRW